MDTPRTQSKPLTGTLTVREALWRIHQANAARSDAVSRDLRLNRLYLAVARKARALDLAAYPQRGRVIRVSARNLLRVREFYKVHEMRFEGEYVLLGFKIRPRAAYA